VLLLTTCAGTLIYLHSFPTRRSSELKQPKPIPHTRLLRQIFHAEGLVGSVASRINPTTNTISPRVDISGAEIVSAQRPACGAISTMPIGQGVNSSAETTGL